ncbi:hypothetical protein EZV62_004366 [Acer yangbiense]|uniref:Gnk2-homologous domain-containing protein n=1 Tax=Acer yangbiense TaxID=1000413 RepID=A0A5C7IJR7_9ROSI|nr:hypothetical protein EZV62_004366 [Acer yangbiense]
MSILVFSGSVSIFLLHLLSFVCIVMSQRSPDDPNTYSYCPPGSNNTASGKFMYNLGGLFNRKLYDEGVKSIYYNTTEGENPDKVYGNYVCRFDYSHETCQNCVIDAINSIVERCNGTKEAIAWYTECMVRYSDKNFFATLETVPTVYEPMNTSRIGNVTLPIEFPKILNQTFTDLISMAPSNSDNCATLESNISNLEPRLYGFAQCTPDLSSEDCRTCLQTAFDQIKQDDHLQGKPGGRVFIPSCFIRYELYQFYGDPIVVGAPVPISPPQGRRTKKETRAWIRIAIITASAVFVMVLFSSFVWCMWRRHNKRDKGNYGFT